MKNLILAFVTCGFLAACGSNNSGPASGSQGSPGLVELRSITGQSVSARPASIRASLKSFNSQKLEVSLTTTDGSTVQVAVDELRRALSSGMRLENRLFTELFVNGDGSITITEPRFLFSGQETLIYRQSSSGGEWTKTQPGACKHFGFQRYLISNSVAYSDNNRANLYPWTVAPTMSTQLNENGEIFSVVNISTYPYFSFFNSITCTEPTI